MSVLVQRRLKVMGLSPFVQKNVSVIKIAFKLI